MALAAAAVAALLRPGAGEARALRRGAAAQPTSRDLAVANDLAKLSENGAASRGFASIAADMAAKMPTSAPPAAPVAAAPPNKAMGPCRAFRATLQCDPSGPRDQQADKACSDNVHDGESGFCDCGGEFHVAAVGCDHSPFNCDLMCLKYAVVMGAPAMYQGKTLMPMEATETLEVLERNEHELNEYEKRVHPLPIKDSTKEVLQAASAHIDGMLDEINRKGEIAVTDVERVVRATDEAQQSAFDKVKEMRGGDKPMYESLDEVGRTAEMEGRRLQEIVAKTFPHGWDMTR